MHVVPKARPLPAPGETMGLEETDRERELVTGTKTRWIVPCPGREDNPISHIRILERVDINRPAMGMPGQLIFSGLLAEMESDAIIGRHGLMVVPGKG